MSEGIYTKWKKRLEEENKNPKPATREKRTISATEKLAEAEKSISKALEDYEHLKELSADATALGLVKQELEVLNSRISEVLAQIQETVLSQQTIIDAKKENVLLEREVLTKLKNML